MALSLAASGCTVSLTWRRREEQALAVVEAIRSAGGQAQALAYEQGGEAAAIELVRQASSQIGPIGILVNNAAMAERRRFEDIGPDDLERMLAVNFKGPFFLCQGVLPGMVEAGWGRIVNIASIGGQSGGTIQPHYAAAKAALINLTHSLAKSYAGRGVTVNAVSPGAIRTEMLTDALKADLEDLASSIPAGRTGTPQEVAAAVRFLCSDDASYVTDQVLDVNGGIGCV